MDGFLLTFPALMQPVQTCRRLGEPSTMARMRWMLGFQRRLAPVGVAHVHAEGRVLPADLAHSSHDHVPRCIGTGRRPVVGPERVAAAPRSRQPPAAAVVLGSQGDDSISPRRRGSAGRGDRLPRCPRGPTRRASTGSTCTRCLTATPARTWRSPSPQSARSSTAPATTWPACKAISHGSLMGAATPA